MKMAKMSAQQMVSRFPKKKKNVSGIANWMLSKALIGQDLTREASSWMLEVELDPRP